MSQNTGHVATGQSFISLVHRVAVGSLSHHYRVCPSERLDVVIRTQATATARPVFSIVTLAKQ
eukprot:407625-Alexandrium_andersonii.AAC.1